MVFEHVIKINSRDAVECGGGGTSGGCRLLQVFFYVLTCRYFSNCVCVYTNNSILINKNGKKLRGFNDGYE